MYLIPYFVRLNSIYSLKIFKMNFSIKSSLLIRLFLMFQPSFQSLLFSAFIPHIFSTFPPGPSSPSLLSYLFSLSSFYPPLPSPSLPFLFSYSQILLLYKVFSHCFPLESMLSDPSRQYSYTTPSLVLFSSLKLPLKILI